jgi:hypothetical protein
MKLFLYECLNSILSSHPPNSPVLNGDRFRLSAEKFLTCSDLNAETLDAISVSRKAVSCIKCNDLISARVLLSGVRAHLDSIDNTGLDYYLCNSWFLHATSFLQLSNQTFLKCANTIIEAINNDIILYSRFDLSFFVDSHLMLLGRLICLHPYLDSELFIQHSSSLLLSLLDNSPYRCILGDSTSILANCSNLADLHLLLCRPLNSLFLFHASSTVFDLRSYSLFTDILSRIVQTPTFFSHPSRLMAKTNLLLLLDHSMSFDLLLYSTISNSSFNCLDFYKSLSFSVSSPLALWIPIFLKALIFQSHSNNSVFDNTTISDFIFSQPDYIICNFLKSRIKSICFAS